MQLLLDQVAVLLSGPLHADHLAPGTEARLVASMAGMVVMVFVVQRFFWIWPRRVWRPLGLLPDEATMALEPALREGYALRLRIVNVTPSHLSRDGSPHVHVSIWGRPPSQGAGASRPDAGGKLRPRAQGAA